VRGGASPRVLFLTESFLPVLGGGERHIDSLTRGLAAEGTPVTVLTRQGEASWPRDEVQAGVHIIRVPPAGPGRMGKYRMVPHALAALRRLSGTYDVLVVRGTRVLGLPGLLAARTLGAAVVLQAEVNGEMSGEVYTWGTPWDRPSVRSAVRGAVRLRNRLVGDADAFVAMSAALRDEFLAAGIPPERIAHIPHGVDTRRFSPAQPGARGALRGRFGVPAQALVIAYTGRLLRGKGLEDLLEAFARLLPQRAEAVLLVVGSGEGQSLSVEDALRRRAAQPDLAGRVVFTGRIEDVEQALQAADVFVFPSVFEALGLSLVEAAACGLPAVGARTGGIPDVIAEGRSGLLFPPGDVAGLEAALRSLASDPARRAAMGAEARRVACARFDADAALVRYRALFAEVNSRRDASARARAARAGAAPPRSPAPPA
jgi:glycosyltransferase involved in cell wall biosynthesis